MRGVLSHMWELLSSSGRGNELGREQAMESDGPEFESQLLLCDLVTSGCYLTPSSELLHL